MGDPSLAVDSPEESSKALVLHEYAMIEAQAGEYGWGSLIRDLGDYYVIYVHLHKPGGRVFVLRLECDDYPRQPPQAGFVDPAWWENMDLAERGDASFFPQGEYMQTGRGPLPVMCIRGQRDYYAAGWHAGWSNPPHNLDTLYQLVLNVRNAVYGRWS